MDDDFARKFPSQFGTGSEDYYGWAGGMTPEREDEFSAPFASNVRVGGIPMLDTKRGKVFVKTRGYNICSRSRSLDATPFARRFTFDMEAFDMTGGRDNWLQYTLVTHWYGEPGVNHNRPPMPTAAAIPVPQVEEVERFRDAAREQPYVLDGAVELEHLVERELSAGIVAERIKTSKGAGQRFSNDEVLLVKAIRPGDFVEFTLTEQYTAKRLTLHVGQGESGAKFKILVNGAPVSGRDCVDGYFGLPLRGMPALDLGVVKPDGNMIRLKIEVVGKSRLSKGYDLVLDAVTVQDVGK